MNIQGNMLASNDGGGHDAVRQYRRTDLPKPYRDPETWEANLAKALASDPRRKENYEKYLRASKSDDVDYLPTRLDVENVSRCNFRCTMCQVSDWGPTSQRARDMTYEEFKDLIDEQYGLIEIKLCGTGEPLLAREDFFKMIRYARDKNIWVRTNSNGSLLHFQDNYKKLIDSGINQVQISIDGATKETFESIRRGSRFELVVANAKLINDYCKSLGIDRTRMWIMVQRKNISEFLDFVEIGHEMGFKRLTYSLELHGWGQEQWNDINRGETVEDSVTPELAQKAIERGKELGIEVTFWNVTEKYDSASPETICPWPNQFAYVSSEMKIVPCCMIGNPSVLELGDAHDFTTAWNSKRYKEFRRDHLEGRIPKPCQMCYVHNESSS